MMETREFVGYWFAPEQAEDLSRIARVLINRPRTDDPLRVALSRMIVTKEMGASLARDTSHNRPHRVADENDFDVFDEFVKVCEEGRGADRDSWQAPSPEHQTHRRAQSRASYLPVRWRCVSPRLRT